MKKFQALMKSRFENAKKDNKGFSLVELIIAVVILGIIAVVAIGGLYGNVTKSRQNTDVSNAQSIQSALSTLSADKDFYTWAKDGTETTPVTFVYRWADSQPTIEDTDTVNSKKVSDKVKTILTDGFPTTKAGGHYKLEIKGIGGNVIVTCRVYSTAAVDGTGETDNDLVKAAE